MMSATRIHMAQWGTRQITGASSFGVVTSFERISDLMTQTETDESGAVCRVVGYDERNRIVFCVQAAAAAPKPEPGAAIIVDGEEGWVVHAEVVEQNTAFKKIRVTVERFRGCDKLG